MPYHTSILFVTDLDGTLLRSDGTISPRTKGLITQMLHDGAKISIATARTCATALPKLNGIPLTLPIITMNGTVLYDIVSQKPIEEKSIPHQAAKEILSVFHRHGKNCFSHTLHQNQLDIYYDGLFHPIEREFYEERKDLPLKRYLNKPLPEQEPVVYFTAMDTLNEIQTICQEIRSLSCSKLFQSTYYKDVYHPGYYFLEIYQKDASKRNALLSLKRICRAETVAAFGDNHNDLSMIQAADWGFAVSNASDELKAAAREVIGSHDEDAVAEKMAELFYQT